MDEAARIAGAIGVILGRRFRLGLYGELTAGVHAGLGPSNYPVLSAVDREGPASAAAIAAGLGLDRSVVSRQATALVDAGLLQVETNPADGRRVLLALTAAGRDAIAVMRDRLNEAVARQIDSWSGPEQVAFADLLQRFVVGGQLGGTAR